MIPAAQHGADEVTVHRTCSKCEGSGAIADVVDRVREIIMAQRCTVCDGRGFVITVRKQPKAPR